MLISEVAERTGLTKKAVRYYEREGLIYPAILENQYRDYSRKDLERLLQIAVLRQLDFSVKDIRVILDAPEKWQEILQNQLVKLSEKYSRIEKNRQIIGMCLEKLETKNDVGLITNQLDKLNQSLGLTAREREGFMQKELQRIFPGYFGKMIVLHFGPFLNEPVDSPEKENAWMELVLFLDQMEEIEYPEEMKEIFGGLAERDLVNYQQHSEELAQKMSSPTREDIEEQKEKMEAMMKRLRDDPNFKKEYNKSIMIKKKLHDQLKQQRYYQVFVEKLKILSEKYRRYQENLIMLGKEVDLTEIEEMYSQT